jgi:hypothetical protein
VIQHVAYAAHASHKDGNLAIDDMISLAFFFLLRPGEYTGTNSDTSPFRFCDVQLFVGARRLQLQTAPEVKIESATFTTLTFTTQKNGVRGEVIGLSRSGNLQLCPVLSTIRQILHLRRHNAAATTPWLVTTPKIAGVRSRPATSRPLFESPWSSSVPPLDYPY